MAIIHWDMRITGKVQGVMYRKTAVQVANRLGLVGYAMNLDDGSVRIEAQGEQALLEEFAMWCRTGPPLAVVADVRITEGPLADHAVFITRH